MDERISAEKNHGHRGESMKLEVVENMNGHNNPH